MNKQQKNEEIEQRNKKIIAEYEEKLQRGEAVIKSKFASLYDISARTLNRILDSAGLRDVPVEKVETKQAEKREEPVNAPTESTTEVQAKTVETVVENQVEEKSIISWTVSANQFISALLSTGESLSVEASNKNYAEILQNLIQGKLTEALLLMSVKERIAAVSMGNFIVDNVGLKYNGSSVSHEIVNEIVEMFERKEPVENLLKFYENLLAASDDFIYKNLWKLIKHTGVEINEEGNVVCYKIVKEDYTDVYTGKISNAVGTIVSMRRADVNNNHQTTCSHGLHVCALDYLKSSSYGNFNIKEGRIVKCVVRPQDFVSIPPDYNFTKARTCRYEVVEDVTDSLYGNK